MERKRREARQQSAPENPVSYNFTGKLVCAICGKHYRRRITNASSKYARPAWICATLKQHGKTSCPSKQIPEDVLLASATKVIQLPCFQEDVFQGQIKEIMVAQSNKLIYVFHDGHEVETRWQNRSRRDSWTDEIRQSARAKAKGGCLHG